MKKLILLLIVIAAAFIFYTRDRLYIRDPLAAVFVDGAKQEGTQVYINYKNDVFLENDNSPTFLKVIQHNNHIGAPTEMHGLHWLVYLADADPVPLLQADTTAVVDTMTGKKVVFHRGAQVTTVTLY
ncbi:MAG: hypothetical protein ABI142_10835 [Bryocella sp.]